MAKKEKVTEALSDVLADTYTLYLKTQNYHWNVKGPHFPALHEMFGEQYEALAGAIDELAERIRALKAPAPGSFKEFSARTSLKEGKTETLDGNKMVKALTEDHETVVATLSKALKTAQEEGDEATADMLIARIEAHEKFAWMLRSSQK